MNTEELYAKAGLALKRGEAASWEAAEAMAALAGNGESLRQIAARLGCNHATVGRYIQVWNGVAGGDSTKPSFAEAMAGLRGGEYANRVSLPREPEEKAALAAKLLKDKAVADAPVVREVQQRHAERRIKEDLRAFDRERGIPSRGETEQANRRLSLVTNKQFWFGIIANVRAANRSLAEGRREIERTGLPNQQTGELLKELRALDRESAQFREAATRAGIGEVRDVG